MVKCPALDRYERKVLTREDGTFLDCFVSVPQGEEPLPLVFFCQGGGYASMFESLAVGGYLDTSGWVWEKCLLSQRIRFAFVEKRDVAFGSSFLDPEDHELPMPFNYHDTLKFRLEDIDLALDALLQDPLIRTDRVAMVGHGEGAQVAAAAALRHPEEVTHLGYLARGGLSRLAELSLNQRAGLTKTAETEEALEEGMDHFYEDLDTLLQNSHDMKSIYFGYTPAHIASYWLMDPLDDLLQLEIPIFVAVGGGDPHVPPASADMIRLTFLIYERKNLAYKVYPGLDHAFVGPDPADPKVESLFQLPRVFDHFLEWFLAGGPSPSPDD